jgi:branched-chain amino acid aminotransferase
MSEMTPEPDLTVYFNNQFVPLAEAKVGILTHALQYGTGVFEGIRGYWEAAEDELYLVRPFEHYQRWRANCRIPQFELGVEPHQLTQITAELVKRNEFHTNIYIRPLAWRSAQQVGLHADSKVGFSIVAMPFGDYLDSRNGLHAGVASWRRVEDTAIPGRAKICGAYVNSVLASDEARANGFDEAILLNENGQVAEGASCNIFILRGHKLITPPSSDNILEGITRDCVMQLGSHEMGLDVVERSIDRTELYIADEVFFTGTAVEIAPIVKVDHRPIGNGKIGVLTSELRQLYQSAALGRLRKWRDWAFPVYRRLRAGRAA